MKLKKFLAVMIALLISTSFIATMPVFAEATVASTRIKSTAEIQDGAYYVIRLDNVTDSSGTRGNFYICNTLLTDNVLGYKNSNDGVDNCLWKINVVDDGFTLMAGDGENKGLYLNISGSTVALTAAPQTYTLTDGSGDGYNYIIADSYRLRLTNSANVNGGKSSGFVSQTNPSSSLLRIFQVTGVEDETEPPETPITPSPDPEGTSLKQISDIGSIKDGDTYVFAMKNIAPTGMAYGSYALCTELKNPNILNFTAYSDGMDTVGCEWIIGIVDDGYTLKAKDGVNAGKYLSVDGSAITFSDTAVVLNISSKMQIMGGSYYVRFTNSAAGAPGFESGTKSASSEFVIYHKETAASDPNPDPDPDPDFETADLEQINNVNGIAYGGTYVFVMNNIGLSNAADAEKASYALKSESLTSRVMGFTKYEDGTNFSGCKWIVTADGLGYTIMAANGANVGMYLHMDGSTLSLSAEPQVLTISGSGTNITITSGSYYVRFSNSVDNTSGFVSGTNSTSSGFALYHEKGTGTEAPPEDYEEMDPPTTEPLIVIGAISDLHVDYGIPDLNPPIRQGTIKACEELNKEGIDVLLVGGDITSNNGYWRWNKTVFDNAQNTVAATCRSASASGRVLYTTGNHEYAAGGSSFNSGDYTAIMKQDVGEFLNAYYLDKNQKYLLAYHYVIEGFHFIVFNTPYNGSDNHGNYVYTAGTINWVENELKSIGKDQTVVVLSHYPLRDSNGISAAGKGMATEYHNQLKDVLLQYPNAIYIYGHDHGGMYYDSDVLERLTPYMTDGTPISTRTVAPTSFISCFAGSMGYYNNGLGGLGTNTPAIVQALVIKIYNDRVVFDVKNYGEQTGAAAEPKSYTVARTVVPDNSTSYGISIESGKTAALTVESELASKAVTWTSSNTAVATVNSNGVVTAVSAGTVTITVSSAAGSATYTVNVTGSSSGSGSGSGSGTVIVPGTVTENKPADVEETIEIDEPVEMNAISEEVEEVSASACVIAVVLVVLAAAFMAVKSKKHG